MRQGIVLFWTFVFVFGLVGSSDDQSMITQGGDMEAVIGFLGDELLISNGDSIAPEVTINSPSAGVTYGSSNVFFNVTTDEVSVCNYSLNSGVTNFSMTAGDFFMDFIAVRNLANGNYNVRFYCFDGSDNLNASMNVSFGVSVAEEEEAASGGGGGGTSGLVLPTKEVEVDSGNLRIRSVVGDRKSREFSLRNGGDESVMIIISVEGEDVEGPNGEIIPFAEFIILKEESISLKSGEEVSIEFDVIAPESLGIFVGFIVMEIDGVRSEIPVSINTQSKETIFDISATVIDSTIEDGEDVRVQIDLLPIGEKEIDITLRYNIRDFRGETYSESSETFYVDGPVSFVKKFSTKKLSSGDYVAAVEIIYLGGFASASSQFEVIDESVLGVFRINVAMIFLIGVVLVVILVVIILLGRFKKIRKYKK